jgi:hypothetical protein
MQKLSERRIYSVYGPHPRSQKRVQKWEERKKKRLVIYSWCPPVAALTRQVEKKKCILTRRQRVIGVAVGCFQNFIRQDR